MTGEHDISPCLSWCEERIIAMSEAMILDSGKPASHVSTTDDQQPLFKRQTQLATLVNSMVERSTTQEAAALKVRLSTSHLWRETFMLRLCFNYALCVPSMLQLCYPYAFYASIML